MRWPVIRSGWPRRKRKGKNSRNSIRISAPRRKKRHISSASSGKGTTPTRPWGASKRSGKSRFAELIHWAVASFSGPIIEEHPSRCFMALSQVRRNFVFWHLVCPPVAEPFLLPSDEAGIDEGLLSLIDGTHQENGLVRA